MSGPEAFREPGCILVGLKSDAAMLTLLAHDTEPSGDFSWPPMPEGVKVLRRREALQAKEHAEPRADCVPGSQVCGELWGCCTAAGHC